MNDKQLFSIGEIAKSIGITRKIILNYEEKGLIRPDVKEGASGNRYYTIDTFTQIRTIRIFQSLGLSLSEIRSYFNGTADLWFLIRRLEEMRDALNLNIERLYERTGKSQGKINEIMVEPQTAYQRQYRTSSVAEKSVLLRNTALEAMRLYGTDTTKRMYCTEHSAKEPDRITFSVAIPPESRGQNVFKVPASRALSTFYHGAYENLPSVEKALVSYGEKLGLPLSETFRHVYLEGPPQHQDPQKFITQVLLFLKDEK